MRTSSNRIASRTLLMTAVLGLMLFAGSFPVFTSQSARAAGMGASGSNDNVLDRIPQKNEGIAARVQSRIEPTYKIQVGLNSEIYPVFANQASLQKRDERTWGTVSVTITNSTDAPLHNRVAVEIPGWSDQEIQIAAMGAGESHTLLFAPTFLPRLFRNRELAAATVAVNVNDAGGRTVFSETVPVRLRAVGDMYWGESFKFAPYIASWITPHDPQVEMVLSRAKEFAPLRRLPGYEEWKDMATQEKSTLTQARAIYRAIQGMGVSYVKSSLTFGGNKNVSERIRMPNESLRDRSANCIDGVVLYASVFENLGMEPAVVLVPGHAYLGVRTAHDSQRYLYFDTALTGRADFDAAVAAAERGMGRTPEAQISMIRIEEARRAGIFPMPESQYSDPVAATGNALHAHRSAAGRDATNLPPQ
ncbi:MAG: hypothetical protein DMG67_01595 [Acidobacteria bacterium]|nr:MAG: hypothetical protein DMG67_01595 [Acidobacteriota bacterium]